MFTVSLRIFFVTMVVFIGSDNLNADEANQIDVLLTSKTKVVVRINGRQRVLRLGEKTSDGFTLLSTEEDEITIKKNGQTYQLRPGKFIQKAAELPPEKAHYVYLNAHGTYFTKGSVNGYYVDFIVDTGANTVALSSREAERIGIDYRMKGKKSRSVTASGISPSYGIDLRSVKVGDIELFNVKATVIKGDFPLHVLLGTSFLERVKVEHTPNAIVIKEKY